MLRVTTTMTGVAGAPYYATFHFEGLLQAEATAAANATRAFWDNVSDRINSSLTINVDDTVEVVDAATNQVVGTFQAVTAPLNGTVVGEPLAPFTQALVRWRTGIYVSGRELRGRTFIPGMMESMNTNGVPSASLIADVQAAADNLVGTSDFGIYSPTHFQFALGATASVWSQWAVLRSRRD